MHPFLALILTLLLCLTLLWALAVLAYARSLLSPPRMGDGKALSRLGRVSPADLGLAFESIRFRGADDLRLAAWWVPAEGAKRTVVIVHGYADAKVGALAWAPLFRETTDGGSNLLLVDLRAHGESDGEITTAGVREADDLAAVLEQLATLRPAATGEVVLFGASLGAAAVARLMCEDQYTPATGNVVAVVLDSPVPSFEAGALAHARLMNLPGTAVVGPALRLARRRAGVDFAEAAVLRTLPGLRVPALLVLPAEDAFLSPGDREPFRGAFATLATRHPTSRLFEPACPHLMAASTDPEAYARELANLLKADARPPATHST